MSASNLFNIRHQVRRILLSISALSGLSLEYVVDVLWCIPFEQDKYCYPYLLRTPHTLVYILFVAPSPHADLS